MSFIDGRVRQVSVEKRSLLKKGAGTVPVVVKLLDMSMRQVIEGLLRLLDKFLAFNFAYIYLSTL
jgi:hypothetical protein